MSVCIRLKLRIVKKTCAIFLTSAHIEWLQVSEIKHAKYQGIKNIDPGLQPGYFIALINFQYFFQKLMQSFF